MPRAGGGANEKNGKNEEGGGNLEERRLEYRAYLGLDLIYLFAGVAVDGEVEPDLEDALLRLLQRIAQLFQVGISGVEHRVAHHPLLLAGGYLALHLGDFFLKLAEHLVGIHRVNENRNVDDLVHVDDGSKPAGREEARIRDDEKSACDFLAEVEFAGIDAQRVRRDDVLEVENPGFVNLFRQNRQHIGAFRRLGLFEEV